MKNEQNVPQVRFKGFTDAWEQRKFGNVFEEYSEKNHEELPPLTIIQGKGTILRDESDRNLIYDKAGLKNYKLVNKNDFILHLRSFEGGLEVANSKGIVSPAYHIFHGENVDTGFYYPFFRSKFFISVLLKPHVYGIRDGKSIDVDGMKTIQIPYPKIEEQQAIGNYFKSLDNLITLHQRKCETLQKLKKSMLQKMFPKNGSLYPEIRFAGFTDAWEQRELGEVANNFEYGLNASAKEFDGKNKYIRITDIDDESRMFLSDDITSPDTDLTLTDKYKLEAGDILFARTGASVGKTYLYREKDGLVYYAGFLIRAKINSENDADFVFQNTLTDSYNSFIRITSQRSGQPGVNAQEYQDFTFYLPSLREQQQIGTYFRNLDNLITLHQRKLETLKKMKKSMLQKMFI